MAVGVTVHFKEYLWSVSIVIYIQQADIGACQFSPFSH